MNSVFILLHTRSSIDGVDDIKLIGAYSTKGAAELSMAELKSMPGFSFNPNGFSIDEYPLDKAHWTDGFGEP